MYIYIKLSSDLNELVSDYLITNSISYTSIYLGSINESSYVNRVTTEFETLYKSINSLKEFTSIYYNTHEGIEYSTPKIDDLLLNSEYPAFDLLYIIPGDYMLDNILKFLDDNFIQYCGWVGEMVDAKKL